MYIKNVGQNGLIKIFESSYETDLTSFSCICGK